MKQKTVHTENDLDFDVFWAYNKVLIEYQGELVCQIVDYQKTLFSVRNDIIQSANKLLQATYERVMSGELPS